MSHQEVESKDEEVKTRSPHFAKTERSGLSASETLSRNNLSSSSLGTSCADVDMAPLDGKSENYFALLDSNLQALQNRAQELIDKVNEKRKEDQTLLSNLKESLMVKVSNFSHTLEEQMYQVYDHHNRLLQDKLQEFMEIIERISQLEAELKQVCQTVATVYKDLCVQPEV
ncbi:synaptonemal complex central element protein 2-like isoform X2 [Rhinatrema bivittatum]|nr:synaptonemal complex central element protein 2-like isoform X2 [Rhinatrema bivittatum]XP_029440881.1 synaptonemal complex central element protein 2-like isoform X2 [Rhinatrema bivittatum]